MEGTIFNIQKYSIHDGPGIRTTVFLKGCPLRCMWCHNPESQLPGEEIMYIENRCIECGTCFKICEDDAITMIGSKPQICREKCKLCMKCVDNCPTNALEKVGNIVTTEWVVEQIKKDLIFFDQSKGGVTFSGGEPLYQFEFLYELIKACKDLDIHTTIDTSGYAPWEKLKEASSKSDLILYDIKLMDNKKHKKYIGVSNEIILSNLIKLSKTPVKIFVRIPIIPGINDDEENIKATGEFLSELKISQVNILPYHSIGMDKYNRLSMDYQLTDIKEPTNEKMSKIKSKLDNYNLNVKIGG